MERTESKRKNRPSLDLSGTGVSDDIEPMHGANSMYSMASGEEEEEAEAGDHASPLRSETGEAPLASMENVDISGGVGTPCYVVNMDNMFEQDTILGKAPRKPSCIRRFLCGSRAKAVVQPT